MAFASAAAGGILSGDVTTSDVTTGGVLSDDMTTDGRERKGATTRARLRAATEALIAEHGIEAATTTAIARRCGVSRGAMLHHYPKRSAILIDTVQHFWQRARDITARLADEVSEGRTDVGGFVARLYDEVFPAQSLLTMLELMVARRADPELGRAVEAILTDLFRSYAALGERAFAGRGVAPDKVRAAVTLIVCALRGLRIQHIVDPDDAVVADVRAALVAAAEQILAPAERAYPARQRA